MKVNLYEPREYYAHQLGDPPLPDLLQWTHYQEPGERWFADFAIRGYTYTIREADDGTFYWMYMDRQTELFGECYPTAEDSLADLRKWHQQQIKIADAVRTLLIREAREDQLLWAPNASAEEMVAFSIPDTGQIQNDIIVKPVGLLSDEEVDVVLCGKRHDMDSAKFHRWLLEHEFEIFTWEQQSETESLFSLYKKRRAEKLPADWIPISLGGWGSTSVTIPDCPLLSHIDPKSHPAECGANEGRIKVDHSSRGVADLEMTQ